MTIDRFFPKIHDEGYKFLVIFAIVGLELSIAFLQAYVFTVLLCIYLNDAISLH